MSAKSDRLIKRLAALFVEFSISDWQPLIEELRKSGAHSGLAAEIERQLSIVAARRTPVKRPKKRLAVPKKVFKKPDAQRLLDADLLSLNSALLSRKIFTSLGALKEAAEIAGLKITQDGSRKELVEELTAHLATLSEGARGIAISKLMKASQPEKPDKGSEFERWTSLIMQTRKPI